MEKNERKFASIVVKFSGSDAAAALAKDIQKCRALYAHARDCVVKGNCLGTRCAAVVRTAPTALRPGPAQLCNRFVDQWS